MDAVRKNRLFQHSTMAALVGGLFSGTTSFKELLQHGDLGIGTLDQFDGELIILDGEAFQIRSDGQAYKVKPEDTTPYASTTFFDADTSFSVSEPTSKTSGGRKNRRISTRTECFLCSENDREFPLCGYARCTKTTKTLSATH